MPDRKLDIDDEFWYEANRLTPHGSHKVDKRKGKTGWEKPVDPVVLNKHYEDLMAVYERVFGPGVVPPPSLVPPSYYTPNLVEVVDDWRDDWGTEPTDAQLGFSIGRWGYRKKVS